MTYVPAKMLLEAVERLNGVHPLTVVTLPALLRAGAQQGVDITTTPVEFASTQEMRLLEDYFKLPRPPESERPYRAVWSSQFPWQTKRYGGTTLQRMRRDQAGKGRIFIQVIEGKSRHRWGLLRTAGDELTATSIQDNHVTPVNLADLAVWFGRNVDVSSLSPHITANLPSTANDIERLVAWFQHEFKPHRGDLIGTIYEDSIPPQYQQVQFSSNPVDDATYENLGSLPVAPTYSGGMGHLVEVVEKHIADQGFTSPKGIVQRILTAWLNGDIVILVGQPGTGKSTFAEQIAMAFEKNFDTESAVTISIRADYDEAEFIGYERLDGSAQLREFSTEVLNAPEPLAARIVILEEFNLASVENYLSSVLVATQSSDRMIRLPSGEAVQLPIDAFIIGTCNSYRDEPETRMRVSSPAKRRSTIITMPNVLAVRYEEGGKESVIEFAVEMIQNEVKRIQERLSADRGSQFDVLRRDLLSTVSAPSDLSEDVKESLGEICRALLETPVGASWFTAGILRDVALTIAQAERNSNAELDALGDAIASKIVHQLRGTHSDIQDFRAAVAGLPNGDEIIELTDRMMNGPSDDLISLL
ncbi:AAA family ATPase [Corynebacterium sanguinis]|uniref:AAA family ATPase n=1 Tax=Corynebacterium sanguinis TaxID=2594913 RepID=UPI00223AF97A|nr:AAA family ATPase [Corynebacterium sanguinis]MCT2289141.1 AAA family ATPase [Corynebacterium sanguinis]